MLICGRSVVCVSRRNAGELWYGRCTRDPDRLRIVEGKSTNPNNDGVGRKRVEILLSRLQHKIGLRHWYVSRRAGNRVDMLRLPCVASTHHHASACCSNGDERGNGGYNSRRLGDEGNAEF